MKRILLIAALALAAVLGRPAPAAADLTFFLGMSPTPELRGTRGFAAGINMLVIGFEFDYSHTSEDAAGAAPSLRTGMLNGIIMTPTKTQLYLTAGGGFYREVLADDGKNGFGTNIGGGAKIPLLGPVNLRVDYRIYNLRGSARHKTPQRFYAGINFRF
jgi:hypothetical protein